MEECTFQPQVYSRPDQRRNWDQYLEDQKKYEENVAMKRNMIKDQEKNTETDQIYHPQVCKKSEDMVKDRRQGPVHNRLYEIATKRQ